MPCGPSTGAGQQGARRGRAQGRSGRVALCFGERPVADELPKGRIARGYALMKLAATELPSMAGRLLRQGEQPMDAALLKASAERALRTLGELRGLAMKVGQLIYGHRWGWAIYPAGRFRVRRPQSAPMAWLSLATADNFRPPTFSRLRPMKTRKMMMKTSHRHRMLRAS